jgi:hypothetical protein
MTDKELKRKLNQLAELANELDAEAKWRYGAAGFLFYEATGCFHIMDGDCDTTAQRITHSRVRSTTICNMGAGAW